MQGRKTGGRTKGVPNRAPKGSPIRVVCQRLVEDAAYRQMFEQRLRAGTMQAGLEAMVWHYAYGKPPERVEFPDGKTVDVVKFVLVNAA